ncbi:MAG: bifunctional diaminohydroxyphosphoribosylaminopyrimidine deaminase/5-amino-6-(5-phosphoribosylamino)uracil reductase RibD [Gemmatimonadota bacterium]
MTEPLAGGEDARFMRRAIELARRGWGRVAPNPLVGAVIVLDDRIVGEGWHREHGGPHAEVEALRAAGDLARGATLYVSLEPCSHRGKTGPCTQAILEAGISRVVFACHDPNPVAGGGGALLGEAGVDVLSGVQEHLSRALNAAFFHAHADPPPHRPWTELKLALSLDGRVADLAGRSAWITGERARAEVHRLRAGHDAIAVGIGTALADDPMLSVRTEPEPRRTPVRIVFDRNLRLPLSSRLVASAKDLPVWVVAGPESSEDARGALEANGVRVLSAAGLQDSLRALRDAGIDSLFCEGGAQLASAMLQAQLVDRLTLFYAPLFLGADGADPFRDLSSQPLDQAERWRRVDTRAFGADTMIVLDR